DRPGPGDGDVVQTDTDHQVGHTHPLRGQGLVGVEVVVRVVVVAIRTPDQHRPVGQVQLDVVAQPDRAGEIPSGRHHDPAPAGCRDLVDGLLDSGGVLGDPVADRTAVPYREFSQHIL